MSDRDRLIELLKPHVSGTACLCESGSCELTSCRDCKARRLSDHLLANGVIVPPCKVGDTVYTNFAMQGWYLRNKDKPYSAKVVFIGLNNSEEMGGGFFNVVYGKHDYMMQFRFSDIGKSVFLTKEEAEAELRKRGKENA